MKVKELIELLEKTEFSCRRNTYRNNGSFVNEEEVSTFEFKEFGDWQYGWNGGHRDFIIIEKDYAIYKKYCSISKLLNDEEVINMEVFKLKSLKLINDYALSSSNTKWENNKSEIVIIVK